MLLTCIIPSALAYNSCLLYLTFFFFCFSPASKCSSFHFPFNCFRNHHITFPWASFAIWISSHRLSALSPMKVSLSFLILLGRKCALFTTKGGAWLFKTCVQALLMKLNKNKRSNSAAMDKMSTQVEEFVHKYFQEKKQKEM